MCRIAGIIHKGYNAEELKYRIQAMNDSMKHGGPDGEGIFLDESEGLAFGHRRLALLDLSTAGQQPMSDDHGYYQIIFNGEIYNYLQIKQELIILGYHFRTGTDTEVILKAYIQWGNLAFEKLNGMFAIAIYDQRKKEIILARDVMGIKPLYYYQSEKGLIFSSEVKAFQHSGLKFEDHPDWKIYFLSYGFIPEPFTTLKDVFELKPGVMLKYNLHTKKSISKTFEKIRFSEHIVKTDEIYERIRDTLTRAVQRHLIADAPIGIFLSGGIDSSLVALLAAKNHTQPINTLSVTFSEDNYSEKTFQELISKKTGGKHTYYQVTETDYLESIPALSLAFDQPSNDAINTWFITKCAKQEGLKAVLSGLGGDELFGGYPSFNRIKAIKRMQWMNLKLFGIADHLSDDRLKKLSFLKNNNITGDYLFLRGFYTPKTISQLIDSTEREVENALKKVPYSLKKESLHPQNYVSWMEQRIYMRSQLLKDTDYMSMQHGIEVRVPFLDKEFVKLVCKISPAIKFGGKYPKQCLVESFGDLLPPAIYQRKKMGFTFPFQEWNKNHPNMLELAHHPNKTVSELAQRFLDNKLHWSRCFALIQIKDHLPKIDALFITLKTFSLTGGIEKVNRVLMKAGTDLQSEQLIRFNAISLYDQLPDNKYISKRRFKGFNGKLRRFIIAAVKQGKKSDVVMLSHINLSLVGLLIKIFSPETRVILQAHGIEIWGKQSQLKKSFLKKVNLILSVSRYTRDKIIENQEIDPKKILVFNNSLDPYFEANCSIKKNQAMKDFLKLKDDDKVMLTLTRMASSEKYKGYDQVIESIPELKLQYPNIKYVLAGKYDPNELQRVKKLINRHQCEEAVIIPGFIDDEQLNALFSVADLFVMPSKKEGFGIVFIEAMACGIPVIGGNKDGTADALRDGELGTLIDPDSKESLINSLKFLLAKTESVQEKIHLQKMAIHYFGYQAYKAQLKKLLLNN